MNNKNIIFVVLIILALILSPVLKAEEFTTPEEFTEYIYNNFSEENFAEVYSNFAAELKRILKEDEYLQFQQHNFEKYSLEYTEIEVGKAEKIDFSELKNKFDYASDFGSYYKLEVSYLIKFRRLGSRQERSEKKVYLRKINDEFQLFWDYQSALGDDQAANRADQDE